MYNNITNINKNINITLFFCDIHGTVDGGCSEKECKRFAELLEQLREKNGSDLLLFGMLSTEEPTIIIDYEQKISKYFNNKTLVIKKQENAETLRETKVSCALIYIESLNKYYNIDTIFWADDTEFIQVMFSDLLKDKTEITLNSIIPRKGENNLAFINTELENKYIKNTFLKRQKKYKTSIFKYHMVK